MTFHRHIAALGLALLILFIGIAALPEAQLLERPNLIAPAFLNSMWDPTMIDFSLNSIFGRGHYRGGFLLWFPYLLGLVLGTGLAIMNWGRFHAVNPRVWLALALMLAVLPSLWRLAIGGQRLYYPGDPGALINDALGWGNLVPSILVAMPFIALFLAAVENRLSASDTWLTWRAAARWAALLTAMLAFTAFFQPPHWLLLLPLIMAWAAPRLRRIGLLCFSFMFASLAVIAFSAHYRFLRVLVTVNCPAFFPRRPNRAHRSAGD